MEFRLHHIIDHLYNFFLENDGSENCAQLLEEEVNKIFGTKYLNDEHDCNVVSMNSLNIHDDNDMQSYKLGDVIFDEDDIFTPPSFDEKIYYDENMPPTYDDYCADTYAIKSSDYIYKNCHDYDYPFSEHYSFNVETIYIIQVSYDTPTIPNEKNFAYVESSKISMQADHEKKCFMCWLYG